MNKSRDALTILFISHVNPVLRSGGNEIRLLKMINWLRAEGFHIILLLNHPPLPRDMRDQLLEIVDAVYTPDECPTSLPKKISNLVNRFLSPQPIPITESEKVRAFHGKPYLIQATGVLCKRYRPTAVVAEYVFTTPCLREVPSGVLTFVDTHDMFSRRDPEDPLYCSPEEERAYLLTVDVVIAIQAAEAEHFRALVPERKVVTVGVDYEVVTQRRTGDEISGNIVLVVGSNYPANIAGLKDFCELAWPLVCNEHPGAELWVAGKIGEAISNKVPRARVLGWVENLQALYRQSAVVINPTVTGSGLKIKTVEALCNGKPLVATPNAVEGLVFEGEPPFIVRDNWPEFAGSIVSLLGSDVRRVALQKSALRYAQEQFASSRVYAELADILRCQVA